ncbi:MAG: hypothetical protein K8H88_27575 [Sandaracinaceae bacterium]|nr:hypothetical protein [Sandaracinaceae bacterium]
MVRAVILATFMIGCVIGCVIGCGPSAGAYPFVREAGCEQGCDPDSGARDAGVADAGPPVDAGPPAIPDEPLEDWDTTDQGPLSGVFAVEVLIPARAVIDLETRQIYRLRLLQRGQDVRVRITPCRFSLPSVPGVATLVIPPRLEEVLRSLAIEDQGQFLSAPDPIGATLAPPRTTIVLGAELTDPVADPLPTRDAQSSAIDQDTDGEPGVTVGVDTGLCRSPEELYAALRASVALSARIEDVDRFSGTVDPTLDQSVLGVSHRCLNAAASLQIELVDGATFTAVRVGDGQDLDMNGNVSCPEIAWAAVPLFGEYWSTAR